MFKVKELLLVVGVIFLVMLPYIWKGQDVQVNVWDNLDSNVVWYKMLKDQGKIFAGPEVMVQGFVTETPRFSYPSGWNVEAVLYYLLPVFAAYWVNKLLIIVCAFTGMLFFFSHYWNRNRYEVILIALVWATLAFNQHIGISIAGLPLLVWSFYNLKRKNKVSLSLFVVIFYTFYSSVVLVGFFTLFLLIMLVVHWRFLDGKFSRLAIIGIVLMVVGYLLQEKNLFHFLFLQNDFVSHRQEMDYRYNAFSNKTPWFFIKNGDHNSVFYWWGYILIFVGVCVYLIFKLMKTSTNIIFRKELLVFAIIFTVSVPFVAAFLTWEGTSNLARTIFPRMHSFNLTRIVFPLPFFMFVVVAYGLIEMRFRHKRTILGLLVSLNIFVYQFEWRNWLNNHVKVLDYQTPSYCQYYADKQFAEIKNFLGEGWDKVKVGSINLPPAVSAYHGFKGIDGYLPLYNLDYKHQFCQIIVGELNKDQELFEHFAHWGNKCYLQNATYPDVFDAYKWKSLEPIEEVSFNFPLLKSSFQVDYLFSAVEVHHEELQLLKLFPDEESAWDIYVYKIIPQ